MASPFSPAFWISGSVTSIAWTKDRHHGCGNIRHGRRLGTAGYWRWFEFRSWFKHFRRPHEQCREPVVDSVMRHGFHEFTRIDLTRIPKSKSSAVQPHRERTPLACSFRRLAENLVPQTSSRQNRTKKVRRRFGRAAQTGTRAACATIPISEFGFNAKRAENAERRRVFA